MSECPDVSELVRVALGERSDAELVTLEAHLDSCADCRRVVASVASEQTLPSNDGYPALGPGDTVGRYTIEGLLGVGGMGIVYAARDPSLGRPVALKLLRAAGDADSTARLAREAQAMARLSHPHVVSVYELGDWQGRPFLAMELVDGLSLDGWRKARNPRAAEVVAVLIQAGQGLQAAHAAGVVHRDFKPGNVLMGQDGRARVTDFGLARAERGVGVGSGSMLETQAGTVLGTPAYMSPEQLAGEVVDARSDQFSFCVTLVEALQGRRPFVGATRVALTQAMNHAPELAGVPRSLRAVLARGLSVKRDDRYPSLDALFTALRRAQSRPRVLATAALVLVLLSGGAGAAVLAQEEQVEVMVAKVDIADNSLLAPEMIQVRLMPAKFVTSSAVRPNAANYVLGQLLLVPVQAGDILQWSQFESPNVKK